MFWLEKVFLLLINYLDWQKDKTKYGNELLLKNVPFEIDFLDDATFLLRPLSKLEMSKDYVIKIDMSKLKDFADNFSDIVYQFKFKTITGLEFTGVTGRVYNYDEKKI